MKNDGLELVEHFAVVSYKSKDKLLIHSKPGIVHFSCTHSHLRGLCIVLLKSFVFHMHNGNLGKPSVSSIV